MYTTTVGELIPILRLGMVVDRDPKSPSLDQVRIFPDGLAVATNGRILSQALHSLPVTEDFGIACAFFLSLAVRDLEKVAKKDPNRQVQIELLNSSGDEFVVLHYEGCPHPKGTFLIRAMQPFPYTGNFIPHMSVIGNSKRRICIDFDQLTKAVKGMGPASASPGNSVVLEWEGEGQALKVYRPEHDRAMTVLMPIMLAKDAPCRAKEVTEEVEDVHR